MEETQVKKINEALHQSILHYDPQRKIFAVTENELTQIDLSQNSFFKDIGIGGIFLSIPCIINAITLIAEKGAKEIVKLTDIADIFLNALFGLVGLFLGGVFLLLWHRQNQTKKKVIETIKTRQPFEL